ncbi:MAG: Elongation factor G [Candidatus Izimaplasma bacterium HR2]|nr:MAG: Elongation factor G [Candidatus Izimaplasma bacterium HR2]
MKKYDVKNIRTIAVMGHHGSGKTSFMESVLYVTGSKKKKGSVDDKNTTSDYLLEEKEHQASMSMSLIPVEYEGYKINFLDTPGNAEFASEVTQALSVVKGAVLMIDGAKGIDIVTEQVLNDLNQKNIPTIIFINKMDKDNVKFEELMSKLHKMIGNKAVPFLTPIIENNEFKGYINIIDMVTRVIEGGKLVDKEIPESYMDGVNELRESIIESVAMTSEELLDKHFSGEELSYEEICQGLREGVLSGDLKPVVIGSVIDDIGVRDILEMFEKFMPAPNDLKPVEGKHPKTGDIIVRKTTNEEPFSAYVFKTTIDPFIGSVNLIKIFSGSLSSGDKILIPNTNETIKIGNVSIICGKDQTDVDTLYAGDIGTVTKIDEISTGFTLCDIKEPIIYEGPGFPTATIYVAISPKNKKDEDKISSALQKLNSEDPSFEYKRNRETAQLLIGGQGMIHISYILEKLKNMFKVDVDIQDQKIVYRETIKLKVESEGRHKKQSGGSGQFGVVKMLFEPINANTEDFQFEEKIHGGSVPRNYWPAVEKGLLENFQKGPLAGFPVIGVKATLLDGAYHAVDSNELSFKLAAQLAFKNACKTAKPTLLEPIMKLEITVKDDYVGDVMGDVNKRRGHVLGMEPLPGGKQKIIGEAPEAEIMSYTIDLKAMTQGTGVFQRKFVRYDEVPESLQARILAQLEQNK